MILYLSRQGALPLGKIGERLQVHPTSVTSLIDGLEKQGYVIREPHEPTAARSSRRSPRRDARSPRRRRPTSTRAASRQLR